MFSIIIPLYNKAAYVEKAIRSVLNQTYQGFELIIVNDGSTDASLDLIQQFNNSIIQQFNIVNQTNQGVSVARNNGVKFAKYEYVAFLDADDWWEPTYLAEMKKLLETYPEAGIYGSSYFIVRNGQNLPAKIGVDSDFKSGLVNYCKAYARTFYMPLWTGATVIRKSVFDEEHGFKPNLVLGEDFDLWIRIVLKHPMAFINTPLSFYNQDVELLHKAVVFEKIYAPSSLYIFNLDYLIEDERTNKELKYLLDLLRVYSFERYILQGAYLFEVKKEIAKVNFRNVPFSYWIIYHFPIWTIRFWFQFKKIISNLKSRVLK